MEDAYRGHSDEVVANNKQESSASQVLSEDLSIEDIKASLLNKEQANRNPNHMESIEEDSEELEQQS